MFFLCGSLKQTSLQSKSLIRYLACHANRMMQCQNGSKIILKKLVDYFDESTVFYSVHIFFDRFYKFHFLFNSATKKKNKIHGRRLNVIIDVLIISRELRDSNHEIFLSLAWAISSMRLGLRSHLFLFAIAVEIRP